MPFLKKKTRFFLLGAYGYGNLGDEACRVACSMELKRIWPEVEIRPQGPATRDPRRFNPKPYAAILVGGGGILYEWHHPNGAENLAYYLEYLARAQRAGKFTALLGAGTQGEFTNYARRFAKILNRIDLITVRDERSREDLKALGVTAPIHVCADPSWLLATPSGRKGELLGAAATLTSPNDTINPYRPEFNREYKKFLRLRAGEWLPYALDSRFPPVEPSLTASSPEIMLKLMLLCKRFVTNRYHGFIFASLLGSPALAITDPGAKLDRLTEALGYRHKLYYRQATARALDESVDELSSPPSTQAMKAKAKQIFKLLEEAHG